MIAGLFEILMLLCFAVSWPFNILKSYRVRTAVGKSIMFETLVEIGYVCGMVNKIVSDDVNYVFAFYLLDFGLVAADMLLWARNKRLDAARVSKA
ncbi:hypothetical protein TALC_00989 [Thermoplasmatales archaeon BRNA1]|nr:hypothetical protein TALC_00989 [Thermoplasmatales archaeon BRNA1]